MGRLLSMPLRRISGWRMGRGPHGSEEAQLDPRKGFAPQEPWKRGMRLATKLSRKSTLLTCNESLEGFAVVCWGAGQVLPAYSTIGRKAGRITKWIRKDNGRGSGSPLTRASASSKSLQTALLACTWARNTYGLLTSKTVTDGRTKQVRPTARAPFS